MFASITNAARLAKQQRVIHTGSPGSNFIGDLTSVLAQRQPCFTVSLGDVDVLSSPQQFYDTLLVRTVPAHVYIVLTLFWFYRIRFVMHVEEFSYLPYTSAQRTLNW